MNLRAISFSVAVGVSFGVIGGCEHATLAPPSQPSNSAAAVLTTSTTDVCTPGWASSHRDVPLAAYDAALANAGIPYSDRHNYEYDHRIPLELGGSNDPSNLWFEPIEEAHKKDNAENNAHDLVCAGTVQLTTAQTDFANNNWRTYLP